MCVCYLHVASFILLHPFLHISTVTPLHNNPPSQQPPSQQPPFTHTHTLTTPSHDTPLTTQQTGSISAIYINHPSQPPLTTPSHNPLSQPPHNPLTTPSQPFLTTPSHNNLLTTKPTGSITAIYINHPEPPERTSGEGQSQGQHLLTQQFFDMMHRVLTPTGTTTRTTTLYTHIISYHYTNNHTNNHTIYSHQQVQPHEQPHYILTPTGTTTRTTTLYTHIISYHYTNNHTNNHTIYSHQQVPPHEQPHYILTPYLGHYTNKPIVFCFVIPCF